ncbi:cytochrome c-type biogenesis protein CycJ [Phenylobacterium zucineum HLK1]|uniref:Cytochrome c-type biogenesis protein CcmE n=1 Tax=Phenylobacterium zucineum (strain HLK1) TaxID=450851 RepID=CCME_PHEZH|nr:cytochrome c maturation protein CcmE [Phenylobacterium zucineum]B4RHR0.1 RecName: Full=Cytochrome c-type biogenesis protein CcmE; AltName: Full=Cytochrome c maturation protein E; AltName: Full=Heme chaperone CcmE [Phenylobacterium zucineum HLK1]ACG79101.1 cytochrome c-type biogenesis protein CycJ [Phenylobacterium zucineum HLK1]
MSWLPKSPKARRRLMLVAAIAPVLAVAAGLTLWGLSDSISFFYTPSQAEAARPAPGRSIQLGGLVAAGSVVKHPDGRVEFTVADQDAEDRVLFQGDLPDLFREGQGVVAIGAFREDGVFEAKRVLAKHDERYMPREVSKALKEQGEWYGDGQRPEHQGDAL